ncbi:MAG TPA: calcium/sodium antiporter [Clostridiales bacterium]|nr:calcium/sodium antiporter [Clostridiales bacterium]
MPAFFSTVPGAILLLIVGFVLLIKGADVFVEGSSSLAKRFKVPSLIIGLTIVAMGTSLPETAVSVSASITNNNALSISNVVGSNIFNMMIVIGVCAVLASVPVQKKTLKQEFPFSIFCALLLAGLGYFGGTQLGRVDGVIMLVLFAAYITFLIYSAKKSIAEGKEVEDENLEAAEEMKILPLPKSIIYVVLGIAAIAFGGDWTVDAASTLAAAAGVSQTLIGLTIVSIGTSLPELVTSVVAARKKEVDLALGNAIGSNIFNILMVLGLSSVISPLPLQIVDFIDMAVLVAFSLITWLMAWRKKKLGKPEGIIMIVLYIGYVVYICLR